MKAIQLRSPGGPEALVETVLDDPVPKPDEAVLEIEAAGVNFIDVYQRTGLYPVPLPAVLGCEGAGKVIAAGAKAGELEPGTRAAFAGPLGAYAERIALPAAKLIPVPDRISSEEAAAAMLQGMTAHYLVRGAYLVKHGDRCLVHAAAGGVGQLLVQFIKYFGGEVFAVTSTHEKALLAKEVGADTVIVSKDEDFESAVLDHTDGAGVNVVYDSVGKDTFEKSSRCLAPLGTLVSYGQSSGSVPPVDLALLSRASLFLTRPRLADYTATRDQLLHRANTVFELMLADRLRVRIDSRFPLSRVREAHKKLESRESAGKILLLPGGRE
jgi:NADPH2:quinone reductase